MAGSVRRQIPAIVRDVIANSYKYPLHQALRLLEESWYGTDSIRSDRASDMIRLQPAADISFPGSDIKRTHSTHQQQLILELNFMGLYGVDSPLPPYIAALALQDNPNAQRLRTFLAIINRRAYDFYYLSWKKYHVYAQLESRANRYYGYLQNLAAGTLKNSDKQEVSYSGLLGAKRRSATSLRVMLRDYLDGIDVNIRQFQPREFTIINENHLHSAGSSKLRFGNNAVLGNRITDVTNSIAIDIGPLPQALALNYDPDSDAAYALGKLLKRYLGATIDYTLNFIIELPKEKQQRIGDKLSIGWQTWLGNAQPTPSIISIKSERLQTAATAREQKTQPHRISYTFDNA